MGFRLEFSTDNAAFADDARGEVARVLRDIAARIERGATDGLARDINGNMVGGWRLGDDVRIRRARG